MKSEELVELEGKLGVALPDAYYEFLRMMEDGCPDGSYLWKPGQFEFLQEISVGVLEKDEADQLPPG